MRDIFTDIVEIDNILKLERVVLKSFISNDDEYDSEYIKQVLRCVNVLHTQAMDITAKCIYE